VHQDLPKVNQLELISYLIETFQYAKLTIEKKTSKNKNSIAGCSSLYPAYPIQQSP